MLKSTILRFISKKSARSESLDVKLNIRLTHCSSASELLTILKSQPSSITQKTFGMRMLSRIISKRILEVTNLVDPSYAALCKSIGEGVSELRALEMCDLMYWIKTFMVFDINTVSDECFNVAQKRVETLCRQRGLTIKQACSLANDITQCGYTNEAIIEYINDRLPNTSSLIAMQDIKNISNCFKSSKAIANNPLIKKCAKFAAELSSEKTNTQNSLKVIRNLNSYINSNPLEISTSIAQIIENITKNLRFFDHNDLLLAIRIVNEVKSPFSKDFACEIIQKLINYFKSTSDIEEDYIANLISVLDEKNLAQVELLTEIKRHINHKFTEKKIPLLYLSKLCNYSIHCKIISDEIQTHLHHRLLKASAEGGYFDAMLLKSIYTQENLFDKYRLTPSDIEKVLKFKGIKTLIVSAAMIDPETCSAFSSIHTQIIQKILNYIEKSPKHAVFTYTFIQDTELLNRKINPFQICYQKICQTLSTNTFNKDSLILTTLLASDSDLKLYLTQNLPIINITSYKSLLQANLHSLNPHRLNLISETLNDPCFDLK